MQVIDGHSHFYQTFAPTDNLKQTVAEIEGFDTEWLFADLQRVGDGRLIGYASGEPLDTSNRFHRANLEAIEVAVREPCRGCS